MRFRLLLFLFLNVAFFVWARFISTPAGETAASHGQEIPRLKLATEVANDQPARPAESSAPAARCVSVGPFVAEVAALRALAALKAARLQPGIRPVAAEAAPAYLVSQTTESAAQAARIVMRLRAAGQGEAQVMPQAAGASQGAVSFGVYSERARAEQRVADLRKLGVNPAVSEQARTTPTWWLDVNVGAGDAPVDVAALQAGAGSGESIGMGRCPPGSSPTGAPPAADARAPASFATARTG